MIVEYENGRSKSDRNVWFKGPLEVQPQNFYFKIWHWIARIAFIFKFDLKVCNSILLIVAVFLCFCCGSIFPFNIKCDSSAVNFNDLSSWLSLIVVWPVQGTYSARGASFHCINMQATPQRRQFINGRSRELHLPSSLTSPAKLNSETEFSFHFSSQQHSPMNCNQFDSERQAIHAQFDHF